MAIYYYVVRGKWPLKSGAGHLLVTAIICMLMTGGSNCKTADQSRGGFFVEFQNAEKWAQPPPKMLHAKIRIRPRERRARTYHQTILFLLLLSGFSCFSQPASSSIIAAITAPSER